MLFGAIVYFLPSITPYKIELIESYPKSDNEILIYSDLNNDENSELLHLKKDDRGKSSLIVRESGKVWEQWNFRGKFVDGKFHHTGDYNGDEKQEIYVLTYEGDSIFLNVIGAENYNWMIKNLFITTFKYHNNIPDVQVPQHLLANLRNNARKELVIVFQCTFSYVTRKLCTIDLDTKQIRFSPTAGSVIGRDFTFSDINNDGYSEIFGGLMARGNCHEGYPYSDQFSWLQVYTHDLEFLFPPIKIGKYPGRNTSLPLIKNGEKYIANYNLHIGKHAESALALYSSEGKLIRRIHVPYKEKKPRSFLITYPEQSRENLAIVYSDGSIMHFDSDLNIISESKAKTKNSLGGSIIIDIDGDGNKERIFIDHRKEKLMIAKYDMGIISDIELSPPIGPMYISIINKVSSYPSLFIDYGQRAYTFSYAKNKYYTFRYLLLASIFLALLALVSALGWIQHRLVVRSFIARKQIASLQLSVLQNQMNPHFTMNLLNSIGSLYGSNRIEEAELALGKYAKLLRIALMSSDSILESIENELSFVTSYLELEKIRLNGQLDFQVDISDDVDLELTIPKMLIHTFVENAIKHGIKPVIHKRKGNISISVRLIESRLLIDITDNGEGLGSSEKTKEYSTGKGLLILNNMIKLFKKFEDKHIEYFITSKNNLPGTRVDVYMDLKKSKWKRRRATL